VEKRYSLYGFIINESERGLHWVQHVGDWHETGQMMYVTGIAYILKDYDVLLIGRAKAMKAEKEMDTFEEVEKYLASMPKWNKTRYYVKIADIELSSLIECRTGKVVYSEINEEILQKLRMIEKDRSSNS
jgi:hypothetical protein